MRRRSRGRGDPKWTSSADLRDIAELTLGRALTMPELAKLKRSTAAGALRQLPPEVVATGAQRSLKAGSVFDPDEWLRVAHELQQSMARRNVRAGTARPGSTIGRCIRCGTVMPSGMICDCAKSENAGRPGA